MGKESPVLLGKDELGKCCEQRIPLGTFTGLNGEPRVMDVWDIHRIDGEYFRVLYNYMDKDGNSGKPVKLKTGNEFYVLGRLRKLRL